MTRARHIVAALAMILAISPAHAQAPRADRLQRQQQQQAVPLDERPLAQQFRERLAQVVRRRLNLNDTQMQQLGRVNNQYERERMQLLRQERQMRQALRAQMLAGDSADQSRVSALIDEALQIQRQRLDLTEREQRDLGRFMTPVQRAMYFSIQDDLRRRMEELRQQGRPGAVQGRPGALRRGARAPQP